MKLFTVETLPNTEYELLGLVKGTTVQTKHAGRDFMAGMKNLVGGELKGYTEMLRESRSIATNRMIEEAQALGADAIIGIRYTSSEIMQGSAEILAYGTAIKLK